MDTKSRRRKRVCANREKGDALVIKTEQFNYSDVYKTLQNDAKLVDLKADVRSINRTHTSEMIIELKLKRKGAAYKSLAEEVIVEGDEVRPFFILEQSRCCILYNTLKKSRFLYSALAWC